MSALLQIIDLSFSRSHQALFSHLNLSVNTGDRIGLVGHNGCGKSTLLSLIRGHQEFDSGEIRKPRGLRIAWVEQFVPTFLEQMTLLDATLNTLDDEEVPLLGWKAENQLLQLGFNQQQFTVPVTGLSGGQQNLLLIARSLLKEPELLLMDEPGNHMDILALNRLEVFLKTQVHCPFVIVSHDQYLLNNVCSKTVFIRDQRTFEFDLPFDAASKQLQIHDQHAANHRQQEEKEIKRLRATAKRLAIWGRENDNEDLSRKAKSIEKRADKLNGEKTELTEGSKLNLQLDNLALLARQVISLENVEIHTPDNAKKLLSIKHIVIRPGDRVALLGINGVGKSSTLEVIRKKFANNERAENGIRFNPRVTLGYYDQGLDSLNTQESRSDWLRANTQGNEHQIKRTLINSGIPFTDFSRKVNSLSGGEKARMMFMQFQIDQPNLMILDEPTNHIDLFGKQQLTDQLIASGASLIITSHDRYFLEKIANRWLWIDNEELQEIGDSQAFYLSVETRVQHKEVKNEEKLNDATPSLLKVDPNFHQGKEDDILQRIDQLETKLNEDIDRKAKFQKPGLQAKWRQEIESLWNLLQ